MPNESETRKAHSIRRQSTDIPRVPSLSFPDFVLYNSGVDSCDWGLAIWAETIVIFFNQTCSRV